MRCSKLFLIVPITFGLFSCASVSPPKGAEKLSSQPSPGELSIAATGETSDRIYNIPEHGAIKFNVPVEWADKVEQPRGISPPTIEFRPKKGPIFKVMVTPIWYKKPGVPPHSAKEMKEFVEEIAGKRKSILSFKKTSSVMEIQGSAGVGYHFFGTDFMTIGPLDFKYIMQGIIQVGELSATFTILTNDRQETIQANAIKLVKSAIHLPKVNGITVNDITIPTTVTIADLMIPANELPDKCVIIDGEHGFSPQTLLLYKYDESSSALTNILVVNKGYQSLQYNNTVATIYYYQYNNKADALRAMAIIMRLIWGEDSPSSLHPEIIFAVNNIVVVVSSQEPKQFEMVIRNYINKKYGA